MALMTTTPPQIANRIVSAVVGRFADENGICCDHLIGAGHLTPVEVLRAQRALGPEVIFGE